MINIAYLDDDETIREVVASAINDTPDMSCQYTYNNAEDAIKFIPQHSELDIILLDIGLPRLSGIDVLRAVKPQMKAQFCMFTVFEDDDKVLESLILGANGYILKSESIDSVLHSLRELHEGGAPMSPSIARSMLGLMRDKKQNNTDLPISPRQYEVLELLSKGLIYKEIAQELNITVGTVKQTLHKIYRKLHVSNRTEAVNRFLNR